MSSEISKININPNHIKSQTSKTTTNNTTLNSVFCTNSNNELFGSFAIEKTTKTENANQTSNDIVVKNKANASEDIKNPELLANAPSNKITVSGEEKQARIVVSLSSNKLYLYDENGQAEEVHTIASGAKNTPTHKGLRKVSHIETYPYANAEGTKRQKNPKPYGPKILVLNTVDEKTGEIKGSNGEFIHGNSNEASIGKYASHGCMRMHNDQIVRMAEIVKPGSYVLIQD